MISRLKSNDNSRNYRDRVEIMGNILRKTGNGCRKTNIMYGANLNSIQLRKYLALLEEAECIYYDQENQLFKLTPKGANLLQTIYEVTRAKDDLRRSKEKMASLIYLDDIENEALPVR